MSIVTSNQKLGIKKMAAKLATIVTSICVEDFKNALTDIIGSHNRDEQIYSVELTSGLGKKTIHVSIEYFELANKEAIRLSVNDEVSYYSFSGERGA